jgi:predicted membrane protein
MKKVGNWLWGLVLVALGVILGLNALEVTNIEIFFPGWWTLIIIVPCFIGLVMDEHKWGNFVGLLIGVCLLLGCLHVLSFDLVWKLFFPAILVLIGLTVIFHGTAKSAVTKKIRKIREAETVDTETEEFWATFGEQDVNFDGKEFKGCRLDSVFGGIDLDLRGAKMKKDAIVKASSIFGGIVIYAPEDAEVEIASTSIFGGVSDSRKKRAKSADVDGDSETSGTSGKRTLYVEATCVFGGVEIK